jgi:cyclic 2,3-diphosphoglycerate synthase
MAAGAHRGGGAGETRRAITIVDGEHHPPVVRAAIAHLLAGGTDVVEAVVAGGGEKLAVPGRAPDLGVAASAPSDPERALPELISRHDPDVIIDLSGPPVVDARRRLRLAAIALALGVRYEAPGLRYTPPDLSRLPHRTSVAVIGTAKRTGKTAVSAALTRHAMARGRDPVVIAMGRGGPPEPVVVPAGSATGPEALLRVAAQGRHAASDFYEDAVTTGATTVGCFRVGDGPAGQVGHSNVVAGMAAAEQAGGDLFVLEGSGAALPPLHPDAVALVVPAMTTPQDLAAMLPLSFVLADLVLIGFAEEPTAQPAQVRRVARAVRELLDSFPRVRRPDPPVPLVLTSLRPHPLEEIAGARTFLATTAPQAAVPALVHELETVHGADVVGVTSALADRPRLAAELEAAPPHDVLLTEIKAAGIDVAAQHAFDRGTRVVLCDHRPVPVPAPDGLGGTTALPDLDRALHRLVDLADQRRSARG